MREDFQPISVKPPNENMALFRLRCLLDLQLLTIHRFIQHRLCHWHGRALDVGAGESPWRYLMGDGVCYQGVDAVTAGEFGMTRHPDIVYYAGERLPFEDAAFDHVLCTEVLEHVPDPETLLREIARVLRPGGSLVLTVPWSARLHHIPHDYARYSRFGLARLLSNTGFCNVVIEPRGNDFAAMANKLLVVFARLVRPRRKVAIMLSLPCAIVLAPVVVCFLMLAHASMWLHFGSPEDPLGYGVDATRQ
jgi:SAM-dependent methyltransferase